MHSPHKRAGQYRSARNTGDDMTSVIVAGALGVITCGGLFLRRLLGELAEMRRQITRLERQMRAQRARERFLRQLIAMREDEEEDGEAVFEAACVNMRRMSTNCADEGPRPVRRKRHLGLYRGGAVVTAAATITTAARHAARACGNQFISAAAGAAVTAATITMVTLPPWTDESDHGAPSSTPTAVPASSYIPLRSTNAPQPAGSYTPSGSAAPSRAPRTSPEPITQSPVSTTDPRPPRLTRPGVPKPTPVGNLDRGPALPELDSRHHPAVPTPPGPRLRKGRPPHPPALKGARQRPVASCLSPPLASLRTGLRCG